MDTSGGAETSHIGIQTKATQACVRCRQKKNKCDGKSPSCSNCDSRGEECIYRGFQRRRGPGRSKQHMRALEQRLLDLETRLQNPGPEQEGENNAGPASSADEARAGDRPRSHSYEYSPSIADGTPASVQRNPTAFVPHTRDLDIVEMAGRRLPLFKMISENLPRPLRRSPSQSRSMTITPGTILIQPRPSETFLVEKMVHDLCGEFPLFDIPSFLQWIRKPHTLKERGNPSGWACLNASVSVGMLMRTLNESFGDVSPHAWTFFKNAYAALPELLIKSNGLGGVQTILLMAMFMMRASGDTRTAAIFLATGVRVMQTNGIHTTRDGTELETRNRVFWVAYVLDMDVSLGAGISPILHDEDIDIPLPLPDVPQTVGEADPRPGSWNAAVFAYRAELATIQSKIRKQLYSAKAYSLSDDHLAETIVDLGAALISWRSQIPSEVQPGRQGRTSAVAMETSVIMLHLVYYNCVSMVHWAFRRGTTWKPAWQSPDPAIPETRRVQMMVASFKYKMGAKVTSQLLPRMKGKALTDIWRMLPYVLAMGFTLLALILDDPKQTETQLNLSMIGSLVQFVEMLVDEEGLDLGGVMKGCKAIHQVATNALGEAPALEGTEQPLVYTLPQTQSVALQLQQMIHPMYVTQALLGNIPNRDSAIARSLSTALGMPWDEESSFSPWVPEGLRPDTHGFMFEPEDIT